MDKIYRVYLSIQEICGWMELINSRCALFRQDEPCLPVASLTDLIRRQHVAYHKYIANLSVSLIEDVKLSETRSLCASSIVVR